MVTNSVGKNLAPYSSLSKRAQERRRCTSKEDASSSLPRAPVVTPALVSSSVLSSAAQSSAELSSASGSPTYHWLHGATPQPFRRELILKAMDEHERREEKAGGPATEQGVGDEVAR